MQSSHRSRARFPQPGRQPKRPRSGTRPSSRRFLARQFINAKQRARTSIRSMHHGEAAHPMRCRHDPVGNGTISSQHDHSKHERRKCHKHDLHEAEAIPLLLALCLCVGNFSSNRTRGKCHTVNSLISTRNASSSAPNSTTDVEGLTGGFLHTHTHTQKTTTNPLTVREDESKVKCALA
jgi:hypothetical protein